MSDLSEIGAPESELELKYNGRKIGWKLFLRSPDDPVIRKAKRRIEGRMTRIYARKLVAQSKEGGETPSPDAPLDDDSGDAEWGELNYQEREARAVAAVSGWEWTEDEEGDQGCWKGEQPDFDAKLLEEIIDVSRVDIVSQIDAHLSAVALSEKKSQTPSTKQSG